MVRIGIIGLGQSWEDCYEPALRRLTRRVQVAAVYDHVQRRAEQLCTRFTPARCIDGVISLIDTPTVDAILLLDRKWHGRALLHYACARRKPIYIAGDLGPDRAFVEHLHATSVLAGTTVMPELSWRYTPTTSRLQELLATRLGIPHTVNIRFATTAGAAERDTLSAIDWCRYVCGARPRAVTAAESPAPAENATLRTLTLTQTTTSGRTSTARIEVAIATQGPGIAGAVYQLQCARGRASIASPTQLCWENTANATVEESLSNDRTSHEVMLDHFCRRVVGGLIPVADLRDVHESLNVLNAAAESLRTGTSVTVPHLA